MNKHNNCGLVVGRIVCTNNEYATVPRLNCRFFCNCLACSTKYYVRINNYKELGIQASNVNIVVY